MHSSGIYQCPTLTVKSVNLVVARDDFLCVMRNRPYFSNCLLLCNESRIEKAMDTSFSDNNWGVRCHRIFYSGYCDYRCAFRAVLDSHSCATGVNIADKEW